MRSRRDATSDAWVATQNAFNDVRWRNDRTGLLVAEDAWRVAGDVARANAVRRIRTGKRTSRELNVVGGIAEAYWLDAWSSAIEEEGGKLPWPRINLDTADPMPQTVRRAASFYANAIEVMNGERLGDIILRAEAADGVSIDAHELGYYLTMQAMGHGIAWTDRHDCFPLVLPRTEGHASRTGRRRWRFDHEIAFRLTTTIC